MKNSKIITSAIILSLALPFAASAKSDFLISKVLNKISLLTTQKTLARTTTPNFLAANTLKLNKETVNNNEEIIDTYSGIKIQLSQNKVSFNYLGDPNDITTPIKNADPSSFELVDTGTYIIATDKNALYIIYGEEQSRYPDIDLSTLKIVKNSQNEIDYLVDKNESYRIEKTNLVPLY